MHKYYKGEGGSTHSATSSSPKVERKKDVQEAYNKYYQGLSKELKSFYTDYENMFGESIHLTSGKREKGERFSHHETGNALDFKASQYQIFYNLYNTKEGLELMNKYQLGIIDETDPRELRGNAPHFHIGKDPHYYKQLSNRLQNFDKLQPKKSFQQRLAEGEKREDILKEPLQGGHYHGDGHDHSNETQTNNSSQPLGGGYIHEDFTAYNFEKDAEKAVLNYEKSNDPDRQELIEENNKVTQEKAIQEQFLELMNSGNSSNLNNITANISNNSESRVMDPLPQVDYSAVIQANPTNFIFDI